MKKIFRLLSILFTSILLSCNEIDSGIEAIVVQSLQIKPATATIKIGSSIQLSALSTPEYDNLQLTWSSDNSDVATVTRFGLVLGVSTGVTQISCSYLDQCIATATIHVVSQNNKPDEEDKESEESKDDKDDEECHAGNISTNSLSALLSKSLIFSSRQLRYPGTVMQCFDLYDSSENGYIYFTQCAGDSATGNKWLVVLSRVKRGPYGDNTSSGEAMFLRWFGHGTVMCVEQATDGGEDFVWLNSNGTLSGTNYNSNKTFCRLRFEPNKTYEHYAGENFYLNRYTDLKGNSYTTKELQVNIDFKYRRMAVTALATGGRHVIIYDLDQALALKEKSVTLSRTWGGEANTGTTKNSSTTTLMARDMGELKPISSFIIPSVSGSKDYSQTWSLSYQGHAIFNEMIFWWEGEAIEGSSGSGIYNKSIAYLEIFDLNGNRVVPRTKVAAASDFDSMKSLIELNDNCYSEAEGVQFRNGKLYLGLTTHMAGATSANRRSTILEYSIKR